MAHTVGEGLNGDLPALLHGVCQALEQRFQQLSEDFLQGAAREAPVLGLLLYGGQGLPPGALVIVIQAVEVPGQGLRHFTSRTLLTVRRHAGNPW
ncbi:hypothetical protein GDO78_019006 [Eleutherodactylus coqui]|uniref:Uncharacterized protein n=1 Tax=Eleutherodactylus coqui TaxID=57060 RepID=A0A8J6E7N5_ELECQ|nr:hypothetical protein GDO78_019006 [Eleutherodactylus coqui]